MNKNHQRGVHKSRSALFDHSFFLFCQEMNTEERFNTSTNVSIIVLDGDDQYPQFLPCMLLFEDETRRICTSPVYTVNVTEGEEVTTRYPSVTVT